MPVMGIAVSEELREIAAASISKEGRCRIEISADHVRDLREGAFFELHKSSPYAPDPQRCVSFISGIDRGRLNREASYDASPSDTSGRPRLGSFAVPLRNAPAPGSSF